MNKSLKFPVAGLILMVTSLPLFAQSPDSASLEYGAGKDAQMMRAGTQWNWERQWLPSKTGHLGGYWDLTVANWHQSRYQDQRGVSRNITDVGLTPSEKFKPKTTGAAQDASVSHLSVNVSYLF